MDHAAAMRAVQRVRDLGADPGYLGGRQRTVLQPRCQCRPVQQLHDQELDDAIGLLDLAVVVDLGDRRMVEPSRGTGLPAEPLPELGIVAELRGQHFDRYRTVEHGVTGPPDRTHPTAADPVQQDVAVGEPGAGGHRHAVQFGRSPVPDKPEQRGLAKPYRGCHPGIGKPRLNWRTSPAIASSRSSSLFLAASIASSIQAAILAMSATAIPRVVTAGVPSRIPAGANGLRGSYGTVL